MCLNENRRDLTTIDGMYNAIWHVCMLASRALASSTGIGLKASGYIHHIHIPSREARARWIISLSFFINKCGLKQHSPSSNPQTLLLPSLIHFSYIDRTLHGYQIFQTAITQKPVDRIGQ
jgi:hypothetical protein